MDVLARCLESGPILLRKYKKLVISYNSETTKGELNKFYYYFIKIYNFNFRLIVANESRSRELILKLSKCNVEHRS